MGQAARNTKLHLEQARAATRERLLRQSHCLRDWGWGCIPNQIGMSRCRRDWIPSLSRYALRGRSVRDEAIGRIHTVGREHVPLTGHIDLGSKLSYVI